MASQQRELLAIPSRKARTASLLTVGQRTFAHEHAHMPSLSYPCIVYALYFVELVYRYRQCDRVSVDESTEAQAGSNSRLHMDGK